jgi:flagellar protein FlgJ
VSGPSIVGPVAAARTAPSGPNAADAARLRQACQNLEGVFLRHLFQAMRESVPSEGITGDSSSEQMFTTMFDDAMADRAASQLSRGLADALYQQLGRRLAAGQAPQPPTGLP